MAGRRHPRSRTTGSSRSAADLARRRRAGHRRHRRHRHPGLHRHPPPHLGDVDPDLRPGLRADHLLRRDPRQVRAASTGPRTSTPRTAWGALECINAGITTLVDWSHIMNTPDHADAAIDGLQETGIRSVFAFGFPNTSLQVWWFGLGLGRQRRDASTATWRAGSASSTCSDDQGLITMALATRGTELLQAGRRPLRVGAGQGARASTSRSTWRWTASATRRCQLARPQGHGPALPEHDLHPLLAPDRRRVADGPRLRRQRLARAADRAPDGPRLGARPEGRERWASRSGSARTWRRPPRPTSSPRCTRSSRSERGRRHQASWDEDLDGNVATPDLITARQVLRWATLDGAKVAGIADRTGSITPGKKADLVIIDGSAVNVAPIIDPVGGGRLRRRHLERRHRHRRRRHPQARRQAAGRPVRRRAGR